MPSHSPWRSTMVMVPKNDRTLQICIDFWKVNEIARFNTFPMPHVEELLERIGQAWYISMIDMVKGYWQIPLAEKDKQKMAFGTPWGLFEFTTDLLAYTEPWPRFNGLWTKFSPRT